MQRNWQTGRGGTENGLPFHRPLAVFSQTRLPPTRHGFPGRFDLVTGRCWKAVGARSGPAQGMWAGLPVSPREDATEVANKKTPDSARGHLCPKLIDSPDYSKTRKTFSTPPLANVLQVGSLGHRCLSSSAPPAKAGDTSRPEMRSAKRPLSGRGERACP